MPVYYSDYSAAPLEAFFAGRLFVLSACEKKVMSIDTRCPMSSTKVMAHQIKGAFLYRDAERHGWLLVFGGLPPQAGRFWDISNEQLANALALQKLGIPILARDKGTIVVRSSGSRILNAVFRKDRRQPTYRDLFFNQFKKTCT